MSSDPPQPLPRRFPFHRSNARQCCLLVAANLLLAGSPSAGQDAEDWSASKIGGIAIAEFAGAGDHLRVGAEAGAELEATLGTARDAFWRGFDTPRRDELGRQLAQILFAKDLVYLGFDMPMGRWNPQAEFWKRTVGHIDGGIPAIARSKYWDWVEAMRRKEWGLQLHGSSTLRRPGEAAVLTPARLVRAIESTPEQTGLYRLARDWHEYAQAGRTADYFASGADFVRFWLAMVGSNDLASAQRQYATLSALFGAAEIEAVGSRLRTAGLAASGALLDRERFGVSERFDSVVNVMLIELGRGSREAYAKAAYACDGDSGCWPGTSWASAGAAFDEAVAAWGRDAVLDVAGETMQLPRVDNGWGVSGEFRDPRQAMAYRLHSEYPTVGGGDPATRAWRNPRVVRQEQEAQAKQRRRDDIEAAMDWCESDQWRSGVAAWQPQLDMIRTVGGPSARQAVLGFADAFADLRSNAPIPVLADESISAEARAALSGIFDFVYCEPDTIYLRRNACFDEWLLEQGLTDQDVAAINSNYDRRFPVRDDCPRKEF